MRTSPPLLTDEYERRRSRKKRRCGIVTALACVVVFWTVYALILPAVTMERQPVCGLDEHVHTEDCWLETALPAVLSCPEPSHAHTPDCYDADGAVRCGYADFVLHRHDSACVSADGALLCGLPELSAHTHTQDCRAPSAAACAQPEDEGHIHTEACWQDESVLVCEADETDGHMHTDACHAIRQSLICGQDEREAHVHTEICGQTQGALLCTLPEIAPHTHTEDCRDETGRLRCGQTQVLCHQHDAACFIDGQTERTLICGMEEHTHGEDCCARSQPETPYLCGMGAHTHMEVCYAEDGALRCTMPEHAHTASCLTEPEEPIGPDAPAGTEEPEETEAPLIPAELLDISGGPVFRIDAVCVLPEQTARQIGLLAVQANGGNIRDYVLAQTGGAFDLTILNPDNTHPDRDEAGNYLVTPGQEYKLTLGISAPDGIHPGLYTYSLPDGLIVHTGSGKFKIDDVALGVWTVGADGLVNMEFNENADRYTHVTISAAMGVFFEDRDTPYEFDGNITVVIRRPAEDEGFTLEKWGSFLETDGEKTGIEWTVVLQSEAGTDMTGETVTDVLNNENHRYSEQDRAAGVTVTATAPDGQTHVWIAYGEGDGLTWLDNGWEYCIPARITTDDGQTVEPGKGWSYRFQYTTTICDTVPLGIVPYKNKVTSGAVTKEGYLSQTKRGPGVGTVKKNGYLNHDTFHWMIEAELLGWPGEGAGYLRWSFFDWMKMQDSSGNVLPDDLPHVGRADTKNKGDFNYNTPRNMTVWLSTGETRVQLPTVENASGSDRYAYLFEPTRQENYSWWVHLLMRCGCTQEVCSNWDADQGACRRTYGDWCLCWSESSPSTVYIEFDTPAEVALERYGGVGNRANNNVELYDRSKSGSPVGSGHAHVSVPGVFKKVIREDPDSHNGYIASYTITANEGHLDLSGQNPLLIVDTMSDTLVYIPGTMVITAEDPDGTARALVYGTDYTLEYAAAAHTLYITVNEPHTQMYTLQYDAQIVIPAGVTNVQYANHASVELFGKTISSETECKTLADISFAAKNYRVTIAKTDRESGEPLPGAQFGLFTKNGELTASGITDEAGGLVFETNVTQGVILKEHIPYYIQEQQAPAGYALSGEKHWLCFCNTEDCAVCEALAAEYPGVVRVPAAQGATIGLQNSREAYTLPQTGGPGVENHVIAGAALILGALLTGRGAKRRRSNR